MEVSGVPTPLYFTRFLIRVNNYPQSISSIQPCLNSNHPPRNFFPFLLRSQPFSPSSSLNPLSFVSPQFHKNVINHCQESERTFQALAVLEGFSHWMLNLRPIIWKIFHKGEYDERRKIINFKTFKTMRDLWRMDNERGYWIRLFHLWFLSDTRTMQRAAQANHKWFRFGNERNTIEISFNFTEPSISQATKTEPKMLKYFDKFHSLSLCPL